MASKSATLRPDIEAAVIAFYQARRLEDILPISTWLEWARRLAEQRPIIGIGEIGSAWRHPWSVEMYFNGSEWLFNVEPGIVGVRDPFRYKDPDDSSSVRYKAFIDQLEPVWFPISGATWRAIGTDADAGNVEPVPEYFQIRGVTNPATLTATEFGIEIEENLFATEPRLLRACELVLIQPRPALAATIDETGLQLSIIQPPDEDPQLNLLSKFQPSIPGAIPALEQLATGFTDEGFEELHIATLYLLSPPGLDAAGQEPDGSWTPYVENHVYWNVDFAVDQVLENIPATRLEFPGVGLVGGVGDAAIAALVEQNNQLNAQAEALLNQSRISGYFWTV